MEITLRWAVLIARSEGSHWYLALGMGTESYYGPGLLPLWRDMRVFGAVYGERAPLGHAPGPHLH